MTFPYLWSFVLYFHVNTALLVLSFHRFGPKYKYILKLFGATASSKTESCSSRRI